MENLIAVKALIQEAKNKGVDFGKGDPYNRLRYYTKIGWIPNMKRKKTEEGGVDGHYPSWVVDRLLEIEDLKREGLTNEEISKKLTQKNTINIFKTLIQNPENRTKLVIYGSFVILCFILLTEFGIIETGKSKSQLIIQPAQQNTPNQILDSGSGIMPSNRDRIFVKTNSVHNNSKVYISFENDYIPATRYWIEDKITLEGFYLQLDAQVLDDAQFNWWVTN